MEAVGTRARVRPHAVVVPYPCSGNINPALQLAKLLYLQGVYVTFVNTEHNHRCVEATEGAKALRGRDDGFRFETIPDGLSEAERGVQDYGLTLSVSVSSRCAAPLRELVVRLNSTAGVPPVTCVVPTFLMSFALDVARELGLQSMLLFGCSAAALMGHTRLPEVREKGYFPVKEAELETTIDWIPGMPPIKLGDISGFLRRTDDPDNFGLRFNESETTNCAKAGAIILNTFDDLEPDVLAALRAEYPRVYTIGPLGSLLRHHHINDDDGFTGLSLWKQDTEFLTWLDAQEPGSVVYVNFGSHAVLTPEQTAELAWGLAAAGYPFLWATREGGVLPPELLSEVPDKRRRLTTWCPQERVLRHRAVGCFVTHNGWNSTCESIAAGVPMVCWPGFADQYTNSKYACEVWRVGARLDDVIGREQVARRVREVMTRVEDGGWGGGVRGSAETWKAKGEEAVRAGGTSNENLRRMVEALSLEAETSTD